MRHRSQQFSARTGHRFRRFCEKICDRKGRFSRLNGPHFSAPRSTNSPRSLSGYRCLCERQGASRRFLQVNYPRLAVCVSETVTGRERNSAYGSRPRSRSS